MATPLETLDPGKFADPDVTADGARRAWVELDELRTLWFNTGTLCNIECANCYIESSPRNDRLAYLTTAEVERFLDEIAERRLGTEEIGFTGGEPFMNPDFTDMLRASLARGFRALVLTNAMQPMQRPGVRRRLLELRDGPSRGDVADRLTFRVSLDHYTPELHESERGPGAWAHTLAGLRWLVEAGFRVAVAGRTRWDEEEAAARRGYAELFEREAFPVDASDPGALVLFPEMDETVDVPEITVDCWGILGKRPGDVMCASSRMVVKRRGKRPTVVACTLLPYDEAFELGSTLAEAAGAVKLNHPHCAKFCVLGAGSCSAPAEAATRA